jgi:pyruvate kinase
MPTRAEVNDIIKTLDVGADGLVLAGETAIGKHPVETVKIMKRIMNEFGENPEDEAQLLKWLTK